MYESLELSMMNPWIAGFVAGVIHHYIIQYPNQAKLFTTLYTFTLTNAIFIILLLAPNYTSYILRISQILKDYMVFNTVYVFPPEYRVNVADVNGVRIKSRV